MTTTHPVIQAFDGYAEAYDRSIEPLLALKATLHDLIRCQLAGLPETAHVLCAGAGTGAEARFLAPLFPRWHFTLADPSAGMLAVARRHAVAEGFSDRCVFYPGFVSTLAGDPFDAATSVLVSHFLTDAGERQAYFAAIAERLKPGGLLFAADLCADPNSPSFASVMDLWLAVAATPDERKDAFRESFGRQYAAHTPAEVEALIGGAGFTGVAQCVQVALVRGWVAARPTR